jgi:ABC-type antimicrobial peptide transport system permease subunit
LIKQDLLNSNTATAVTETSAPMTELWSNSDGFTWPGSESGDTKTIFNMFSADNDFSKTMNLTVLQGRNIDVQHYKTDSTAVLLNETAVKAMRLKNPIGQTITGNSFSLHVIGVVKDFILESPFDPIRPMLIMGPVFPYYVINFKLNPSPSIAANLQKAEKIFKEYNSQYPFDYRFYDRQYALKFEDEERAGTLAGLFAGLTIFISCLGVFGLAAYVAQNRIKEIGIRKALGASVTNITGLLSKEFLKLVAISFIIASPVAWITMNKWLLNYDYRINIRWWVFAIAGAAALLIALITISFQSIKAALANPVKSLRAE